MQPGTVPHAWSVKENPPPPSIAQVCTEHIPASPHSALVEHNCGKATLHEGRHVPVVEGRDPVATRQQSPASAQDDAEVHELPELPESMSI